MLKLWAMLWIILTVVLIAFPIFFFVFFLSQRSKKVVFKVVDKISHFTVLKKFKNEVLFRWKKTPKFPQIDDELASDAATLQERADAAQEIIVTEEVEIDIIQNIVQAPMDAPVPEFQDEMIQDKESFLKNKKMLEKIIYEALVLRKEGKLDEYEKKLIEWLALDPNDKDLNRFLADYYFSVGNHKKALSLLKKIVELDPKDHKAIWQIGEIYLSSGDFETAELLIEKAIAINPANPKYYVSMVELYYNTDRKHDAIHQLEQVVKLRPTNAWYMLTLADLYREVEDLENAQKYYFRVLEHEPSNEAAKKHLKDLVKE